MGRLTSQIKFLFLESSLTSFMLGMPVAYLIFSDVGLNQFQIGLLQALFMLTILFLEIPTGYLADRFSHRASNAVGDLFLTASMGVYFYASTFSSLLAAEILMGVGFSFTYGADSALLKEHCSRAGVSFKKLAARLESVKYVTAGVGAIIGGLVGAHNIRWPFVIQFAVFFCAFLVALKVKDTGIRRKTDTHPLKDMARVVKYCVHGHSRLFWRILLGSALSTSTFLMVWFMTPSFLEAGISIGWHGVLFALISVAAISGSEFVVARKTSNMTTPFLISAVAYFVLGWQLSIVTILIFLLTSFARGMNSSVVKPHIQEIAPDDIQATAISVFGSVSRVFSITFLLLVNYIGNINLQYGLLSAGVITMLFWVVFKLSESKWA